MGDALAAWKRVAADDVVREQGALYNAEPGDRYVVEGALRAHRISRRSET